MARAKQTTAATAATAENATPEAAQAADPISGGLVRMRKGDAELDVHPLCVPDHIRLGWVEA